MPRLKTKISRLLLLSLMAGLAACSNKSPISLPTDAPALPRLPAEARQEPTLPFCLPTCVEALTKQRGAWQRHLTEAE